jgi:hypothetical protein
MLVAHCLLPCWNVPFDERAKNAKRQKNAKSQKKKFVKGHFFNKKIAKGHF